MAKAAPADLAEAAPAQLGQAARHRPIAGAGLVHVVVGQDEGIVEHRDVDAVALELGVGQVNQLAVLAPLSIGPVPPRLQATDAALDSRQVEQRYQMIDIKHLIAGGVHQPVELVELRMGLVVLDFGQPAAGQSEQVLDGNTAQAALKQVQGLLAEGALVGQEEAADVDRLARLDIHERLVEHRHDQVHFFLAIDLDVEHHLLTGLVVRLRFDIDLQFAPGRLHVDGPAAEMDLLRTGAVGVLGRDDAAVVHIGRQRFVDLGEAVLERDGLPPAQARAVADRQQHPRVPEAALDRTRECRAGSPVAAVQFQRQGLALVARLDDNTDFLLHPFAVRRGPDGDELVSAGLAELERGLASLEDGGGGQGPLDRLGRIDVLPAAHWYRPLPAQTQLAELTQITDLQGAELPDLTEAVPVIHGVGLSGGQAHCHKSARAFQVLVVGEAGLHGDLFLHVHRGASHAEAQFIAVGIQRDSLRLALLPATSVRQDGVDDGRIARLLTRSGNRQGKLAGCGAGQVDLAAALGHRRRQGRIDHRRLRVVVGIGAQQQLLILAQVFQANVDPLRAVGVDEVFALERAVRPGRRTADDLDGERHLLRRHRLVHEVEGLEPQFQLVLHTLAADTHLDLGLAVLAEGHLGRALVLGDGQLVSVERIGVGEAIAGVDPAGVVGR